MDIRMKINDLGAEPTVELYIDNGATITLAAEAATTVGVKLIELAGVARSMRDEKAAAAAVAKLDRRGGQKKRKRRR